jgi:formate hydrogenlyase subunit 6/NADH:ubiquinone oxidoreductase subunit I
MNVIRRSARLGVVTSTYPAVPEPAPSTYRGQILLHTEHCTGDGACARVCPSEAIIVTEEPDAGWTWQLDDARCVFCGLCAEVCPTSAILTSNEFELSVRNRDDLVTRARFGALPSLSRSDMEEEFS